MEKEKPLWVLMLLLLTDSNNGGFCQSEGVSRQTKRASKQEKE